MPFGNGPALSPLKKKTVERPSVITPCGLGASLTSDEGNFTSEGPLWVVKDGAKDLKYLDNRHRRLLSFRGNLYNPGHADSPIKQSIAEKIAGSGLTYEDLKNWTGRSFLYFDETAIVESLIGYKGHKHDENSLHNFKTLRKDFQRLCDIMN